MIVPSKFAARTLISILIFSLFALLVGGATKIDTIIIGVSDFRVFIMLVIATLGVLVFFNKDYRRRFGLILSSRVGLLTCGLLFFTLVSIYIAPTSYSKLILTIFLSIFSLWISMTLFSDLDNLKHFLAFALLGITFGSIFVSLLSFILLVNRNFGIYLSNSFVETTNLRYILYDLGRGRIYPLFPPTYFIGIILFWSFKQFRLSRNITTLLPLILGVIALYASSYRILDLAGTISIIFSGVLILKLKLIKVVCLVLCIALIPAMLLPTNLIKRSSLVEIDDTNTINGRINLVKSFISTAFDNNFSPTGLGNSTEEADRVMENKTGFFPTNQNPHNIYLQLLVEGGLPLFIVYSFMIGYFSYLNFKAIIANSDALDSILSFTCILFYVVSGVERHSLNTFVYIFSIQGIVLSKYITLVHN